MKLTTYVLAIVGIVLFAIVANVALTVLIIWLVKLIW